MGLGVWTALPTPGKSQSSIFFLKNRMSGPLESYPTSIQCQVITDSSSSATASSSSKCKHAREPLYSNSPQNIFDWGQNISDISSKAGVLRRLHTRVRVAYKTLVRSKLEYETPIWSPYCKTQIHQVEKVQRTVACWTCRRVAQH